MTDTKPPPISNLLRELPNLTLIWSSPVRPVLVTEPASKAAQDAAPILVFPGILSSDPATSLMRRTLRRKGYYAYASKLGVVTGVTPRLFARAQARLDHVFDKHQRPMTLVGISLGGLYARVLAQRNPEKVGLVITLGTPFSGDRRANNAWRVYEAINDHGVDDPPFPDDPSQKPPAHTIAIWSPNDGIIAPECSRGLEHERDLAIEVPERHFELSASRRSINRILALLEEHGCV
ncbi:MAG: alpha/beta hydrolase [Erythrobacter sp.]|uniref:alpha/beta hydrolase-fold protein n=1 Tax=Erythrobacter sp. TaxID=1042 RepID=UPI00260CF0B6|nr:alpha/beta hydrolase [Erythrobacter sp.]MDJ0977829.1 alpha/beta hydrolase [Erythrobacter sp.]